MHALAAPAVGLGLSDDYGAVEVLDYYDEWEWVYNENEFRCPSEDEYIPYEPQYTEAELIALGVLEIAPTDIVAASADGFEAGIAPASAGGIVTINTGTSMQMFDALVAAINGAPTNGLLRTIRLTDDFRAWPVHNRTSIVINGGRNILLEGVQVPGVGPNRARRYFTMDTTGTVANQGMARHFRIHANATLEIRNIGLYRSVVTEAPGYGGGVYVWSGGHFIMGVNSEIRGARRAETLNGGAIDATGSGTRVTLNNGAVIRNNHTVGTGSGGGVSVLNGAHLTVNGATLRDNTSGGRGGAIYVSGESTGAGARISEAWLNSGTVIVNNRVGESTGGGVAVLAGARLTMRAGVDIFNNHTSEQYTINVVGGGVSVHGVRASNTEAPSYFIMYGGTIRGNSAGWGGGGVHVTQSAQFVMHDGTIGGPNAADRNRGTYGGGIMVSANARAAGSTVDATFTMRGGTIQNNEALNRTDPVSHVTSGGGGLYLSSATRAIMHDGTITGNIAPSGGVYGVASDQRKSCELYHVWRHHKQ